MKTIKGYHGYETITEQEALDEIALLRAERDAAREEIALLRAAREAWEEVERRRLNVDYNRVTESWCAASPSDRWELGWGATPLKAVADVLARIGEAAQKAEAASA